MPDPTKHPSQEEGSLRKNCVSFVENLAQTLGSMAPSGGLTIFIPFVFTSAGNGTWLLFVPVAAGYALLAANINVFAGRTASAGSFASYAELGLGPTAGLVAGWTYFTALLYATIDCVPSVGFYAAQVAEQLGIHLPNGAAIALMTAAVAVGWWAARRGISLSTNLMLGVECLSLGTMVFLAVLYMVHTGHWVDRDQLTLKGASFGGFRAGAVLAFMSLTGFESVTTLGEESRQALRAIPRAILTCILPMGLIYVAMAYVLVMAFRGSGEDLGKVLIPFTNLASYAGWPRLSLVVGVGITLSFFACMLGCMNAAARVLYALSRQGRLFRGLGRVHPRNATPDRAIALIAVLSMVIPAAFTAAGIGLDDSIAYGAQLASIGFIATYLWVCVSAPFYLRRRGELRASHVAAAAVPIAIFGCAFTASVYPLPAYPWGLIPFLFGGTVLAGVMLSLATRPAPSLPAAPELQPQPD